MSTTLRACSVAIALLLVWGALPALAQYQTPVLDGAVGASEYAQSSGDWSMTWDATFLYVAKTNVTSGNGLAIYIDVDPRSTPAAGTDANGNLSGRNDMWNAAMAGLAPNLPFRADARSLTGGSGAEVRSRDGAGAWASASSTPTDVMTVVLGTTQEVRIRWGAMLASLSAPPASFNWLGFEIRNNGGMTEAASTMPAANPGGGNPLMPYFFHVAATGDGTSSNPFGTVQSTWKVLTNMDAGPGTLRDALTSSEADSTSTRRFIVFGSDIAIISLTSDLPVITKTTTIDGTSHPDWTSDPIVVLSSGGAAQALDFSGASNCVLRGVHINNTFNLRAVRIEAGTGNTVAGNWLGLPAFGSGGSNGDNLVLDGTTNCTVGGTTAADRNVISGAANRGIWVLAASGAQILGNYIGTDSTGLVATGNDTGIYVDNLSTGTVIGSAANGNVIAASTASGIYAEAPVTILGNKIGVGADGSTALGNADDGITFSASNMTIGTIAAPNIIANNEGGISGSNGGGLSIRGNSMFGNTVSGIDLSGIVEPVPGVSTLLDENGLTLTFTTASAMSTQSLRLDLYEADASNLSIPQPATYRASSQCYAGNSFENVAWNVGAGYTPGDKLVLLATSYSDASCTTPNSGTSESTGVLTAAAATSTSLVTSPATYAGLNENVTLTATISSAFGDIAGEVSFLANGTPIGGCEAVAVSANQAQCTNAFGTFGTVTLTAAFQPTSSHAASESTTVPLTIARVFNGPGNFSTASLWTNSTMPASGEPFVIKGTCTFDSASPVRAYGSMTLAAAASVIWSTNHTVALNVTSITGSAPSSIDMTNGGVLRFNGTFNDTNVNFLRGTGTVILSGESQPLPSLSFNNLTVIGSVNSIIGGGTTTIYGTLDVILSASLTGSTIEMRGSLVNNGTFSPQNLIVPSGVTFSPSMSFGVSGTMTVNGTIVPSASTVITGGGGSVVTGTGTLKVTGTNATNSLGTQYAFTTKTLTNLTAEFIGSAVQHIDTLTFGNLTLNNPSGFTIGAGGTTVSGVLTLTAGVVSGSNNPSINVTNTSPSAVVATAGRLGTAVGLAWTVAAGTNTYTYPVGLTSGPAPVTITLHALGGPTSVRFTAYTPEELLITANYGVDLARDANVIWRGDINIGSTDTYSITTTFAGHTDAGATPSTFVLRRSVASTSSWTAAAATPAATSITSGSLARGISTVQYIATGNQKLDHYGVTAASPQTAGTPFTTTVAAQDFLNETVTELNGLVVTMTSNQGNAEFDSDGNGTYGDNTKALTNGAFTITTRDATAESLRITATDTNGKTGTSSGITVNPAAGAPAALSATASSSTQVALNWSPVAGATSYEIWRSSLNSAYALVTTTALTAHNDSGLTAGRTYLYKIRAAGGTTFSPVDVATTVIFTDPSSLSGVTIKAAHITELQTAVNAMRAAGGLTPTTFSSVTAGNTPARTHVTTLRTALDAARVATGLAALSYTDATISSTVTSIKAAHVTELRAGVQ